MLSYADDEIWLEDIRTQVKKMNDERPDNLFEQSLHELDEDVEPPDIKMLLLAAEWAEIPLQHTEAVTHKPSRRKIIKKIATDGDIYGYRWIKLPNGKWRPFDIPKRVAHTLDDVEVATKADVKHSENIDDNSVHGVFPQADETFTELKINTIRFTADDTRWIQNDSGANICATGDKTGLRDIKKIKPRPVSSVNPNETTSATITEVGYMDLLTTSGELVPIQVYYGTSIDGTIISPQAIATQHRSIFSGWYQMADVDSGTGTLGLTVRHGGTVEFNLQCTNNLWYHAPPSATSQDDPKKGSVASRLSDAQAYQLWHGRMMHPGTNKMESLHLHCKGVSKLRGNAFYKCPSCMSAKLSIKKPLRAAGRRQPIKPKDIEIKPPDIDDDLFDDIYMPDALPGQHFHMDFGFVRGKEFVSKSEEGRTITSTDGYNSYLIIVDRKTRYTWGFLTASKVPPVTHAEAVLRKYKCEHEHRTVRTDQGKELGLSKDFKVMLARQGFVLDPTGSDNSRENGIAERPHRTLAQMMRCGLHSAGLGPEYWSYALLNAIKVLNRTPHRSLGKTPYEAFTGNQPDISKLRTFGCKIYAKKPNTRPYKLDHHSYQGIYLGSTPNGSNVYVKDEVTGQVKLGTHVYFDEAHFTTPTHRAPLAAQALQRLGYHQQEQWIKEYEKEASAITEVQVQLLSEQAKVPKRGSDDAAGYDLTYPGEEYTLKAGETRVFPIDIAITCPPHSYARIAPRSGLTVKRNITSLAGVIDADYRGNVGVVLHNFGTTAQVIKSGTKVAQLIFEQISTPKFRKVKELNMTTRGGQGFGSTDIPNTIRTAIARAPVHVDTTNMQLVFDMPYDIEMSTEPYDYYTHRMVPTNDNNPYLGFDLTLCDTRGQVKVNHCTKGTAAAKLRNWRSELRNSYIIEVNGTAVRTPEDVAKEIKAAKEKQLKEVHILFATQDSKPIHSELGIPQIYHDQLNVIAKHLWHIRHCTPTARDYHEIELRRAVLTNNDVKLLPRHVVAKLKLIVNKVAPVKRPKKLTRRYLIEQPDWNDWRLSEHKQLQQYDDQKTFGPPQPYPKGANLLNLLWTYMIKDDGRKKARCVCNGSPSMGTVTLGETYAASLDQSGSRIFWAVAALKNMIVIGADASNAFAEAPAPKAPLFVTIDKPFREWWISKGRNPIPEGYVLRVKGALQGHPESPRLWAILIDRIIRKLNLLPCHHEPCLYYTKDYNNTGKSIYFLRQVDDFAVACEDKETAQHVIKAINDKMTISVKDLGLIDRFNGVDITQRREYIKLHNTTYINKLIAHHPWLDNITPPPNFPIPMSPDNCFRHDLETAVSATESERKKLEKQYGFKYRQGIGEILYAMVTCRPDIAFAIVKLSQYAVAPAAVHFEAVKQLYIYLKATKDDGIYYWREKWRNDLPPGELPSTKRDDNYTMEPTRHTQPGHILTSAVDSDYATDTSHRKSVSGMVHMLAGGTVLYKTKYQDVIAQSTSEAEFIAAAEAGKQILYLRSILSELGLPQSHATVLLEDNQGALLMANAQKPTKRTRHMDIKHFALQDWVDRDLLLLKRIATESNYSDAMTKPLARTLFYRHMDFIQGKIIPDYATQTKQLQPISRITCLYLPKQDYLRLHLCAHDHIQHGFCVPSSQT